MTPSPTTTGTLHPTLTPASLPSGGGEDPVKPTQVPDWYFFANFTENISDYSSSALIVTGVLSLVFNGIAGPIVEEMYFRGYLLPRISRFGGWSPVINTMLFSIYHFWSPWQILTRITSVLPLVSAVYWKRNIYVGMFTHVLLNSVGVLLTAGLIFSQG